MKLKKLTMKGFGTMITKRIENNYDAPIFIEGARGDGKSTFTWRTCKKLTDPIKKFNPKRDIAFSRDDTTKQLATKEKGIIWSDELVNVAYNRDFYEAGQKILLKALNMYRDSGNVFIGCIPRFVDLDTQIQRLCRLRVVIPHRGLAIIHEPISSIYTKDPWDVKRNMKIEANWTARNKRPKWHKLTTARAYLRFRKLPPKTEELYKIIKKEKRGRVMEEYGRTDDPKEKSFYESLTDEVVTGNLTKDMFSAIIRVKGIQVASAKRAVNDVLTKRGDKHRWGHYIKDAKGMTKSEGKSLPSREGVLGF